MSFLTGLALRWRWPTILVMLLVMIAGAWSLTRMQIALFPDIDFPLITIVTAYPQSGPETVLRDVTIPVEKSVFDLGDLESVQSISSPNLSLVIGEFAFGADMAAIERTVSQDLSSASFPSGVQPPRVARVNIDELPILQISVSRPGDLGELQALVLSQVVPEIEQVPGVFRAQVPSAATAGNIVTRTNGRPSLAISITKDPDANTVDVANGVMETLDQVKSTLPSDVEIVTVFNQAEDIEASINSLQREATLGALFAVVVIFVFLLSIRPTLVTSISIPTSILFGLIVMSAQGMSLNILTLGGLAIAVGRVVDDSIVVLENIYRHIQMGEDRVKASLSATREVAGAITTSTLTTIAVFAPLAFIGGIIGAFFLPFALTVTFALLASLVVALTVVPVLGSLLIKIESGEAAPHAEERETLLQRLYTPLLKWALAHKLYTILLALGLFVGSLALLGGIPQSFLPRGGEDLLNVELRLPRSTTLEAMLVEGGPVEEVESFLGGLRSEGTVDSFMVTVGSGDFTFGAGGGLGKGPNVASILVQLADEADPMETAELLRRELSGEDRTVLVNAVQFGGPGADEMELVLTGDDYALVAATADRIVEALQGIEGLINVESDAIVAGPGQGDLRGSIPISRVDGERAVRITGTIITDDTQATNREVSRRVDRVGLPPGVELRVGGVFSDIDQAFTRMGIAMLVGVVLVYLVMVFTFRSFLSPLVIVFSLPLASIGALAALYLTNRTLGMPALIGGLMLIGLVVTNAIVLIVIVEQLRAKGLSVYDALIHGGRVRLRPILMTAFTTSFALVPLAVLVSKSVIVGAELATVVIGGLMTSTFLTLVVIPVVYSLLRKDRAAAGVAGGSR